MKIRFFSVALALMLVVSFVPTVVVYADDIHATIDGQAVNFQDQGPTIVDGRTLVPVRGVFESLGFEVEWDGDTRTAILIRHDFQLSITIGSHYFTTNDVVHMLDVPAQIIGGRTMLPIRFPLESVGYELDWDESTRTVVVTTNVPTPVTPVPIPAPTPAQTSVSGTWGSISVEGSAAFIENTQAALDVLHSAPSEYADVLTYIGVLRQGYTDAVLPWTSPPTYIVEYGTYTASPTWYASAILRHAVNSRQFLTHHALYIYVPDEVWTGAFADLEALDLQLAFLISVDAPEHEIAWAESFRDALLLEIALMPVVTPAPLVGTWSEISIEGNAQFVRNTQAALDIVRQSPSDYEMVLRYIGVISQGDASGMWAWLEPPTFVVGHATYTASATWYAGGIVHDAIHSKQYHQHFAIYGYVPHEVWTGLVAETEALNIQIYFMIRIGAPEREIQWLEYLRDTAYEWWHFTPWW